MSAQFTSTDSGMDCNMLGCPEMGYEQLMALAELAEAYNLARLSHDGEVIAERRKPRLTMGSAHVALPAGGFLQATAEGERVLAKQALDHVRHAGPGPVADLFCGVGPYALRLASERAVYATDSDASSVAALADAARHTAGLKPIETDVRDLFTDPLMAEELRRFSAVLFNPPRTGAEAQSAEIAHSGVPVVVAVSCEPSTFARDARILVDAGYRLVSVLPVDQFRWAAHIEVVALFML